MTAVLDKLGTHDLDVLDLDEALSRLAANDARKARLVELRFFGGMTIEQVADYLEISLATAKREWTIARGWLYRELVGGDEAPK